MMLLRFYKFYRSYGFGRWQSLRAAWGKCRA